MSCGKNDKVRFFLGLTIISCLLLSSCTKHKQQSPQQKPEVDVDHVVIENQKKLLDSIIQQEAMLIDVPIPLYDDRIIPGCDDIAPSDTLVFGYKSPLSCACAQDFFMSQMERYGWEHLVTFDSIDLLLQFSSPHRFCTIIIKKSDTHPSHSCIFIYIKKSEHECSPISSGLG